jgi:enoyl-CoA hydratase/carnithine racemase
VGAAAPRAQRSRQPELTEHGVADPPAEIPPEAGLQVQVRDAVAFLTLHRPQRLNSQTPATWIWLARLLRGLPGSIRVVVVRGSGRAFSAGLDRSVFATLAAGGSAVDDADIAGFQAGFNALAHPDRITIAAVQGHAIGAGFQLALACDLRIAAADAHFAMAEVGLGLIPDLGGTKRLLDLVGYSRALEICVTGRSIGASEALRLGLVTEVVEPDQLSAAVDALVSVVIAQPRTAVIEAKALLSGAAARTTIEQQAAERAAQLRLLRELSGDASEA